MKLKRDPDQLVAGRFTVIQLAVLGATLAVLAGAALPVTLRVLASRSRSSTRSALEALSRGATKFFRDTGELPDSIAALALDPGVHGWSGPYLPGDAGGAAALADEYRRDSWSNDFTFRLVDGAVLIASAGPDGVSGSEDDLSTRVDVEWLRRDQTLEELRTINQAITTYNAERLSSAPLDVNWPTALESLAAAGMLPAQGGFSTDAWGRPYVADPPGKAPLLRVQSSSLDSPQRAEVAPGR